MILLVLNDERRCTVEQIVELTNLGENKIRSAIEFMIESGLVDASGKGKNRTCILGKKIYRENKKEIQYVRQTDIDSIRYPELVMKLANTQNGIITKQDVIELLKVTPSQAYTVIKKLQGFTLLKADVTANNDDDKALQKLYGIVGPPGLIFWDKDKKEVTSSKIVGYKNPTDFLQIVNKNF